MWCVVLHSIGPYSKGLYVPTSVFFEKLMKLKDCFGRCDPEVGFIFEHYELSY